MVVLSSLRATLWSFGHRPPPASAAAAVLVLGAGIVKRQLSALSERITESASGELEGPAELGWRIRNRCDQLFSKHSSPPQGFGLAGGVPFIHSTHSSPPQGFQPRWRGTFLCGCQKLRCGVSWAPRKADAAERREADAAKTAAAAFGAAGTSVLRWCYMPLTPYVLGAIIFGCGTSRSQTSSWSGGTA